MFSWTCTGRPWLNTYWLYDALIYRLYAGGGFPAIIIYKSVMTVLIFGFVYQRLRLRTIPGVWMLAGLALAFWGSRLSHTGWGERASLVTYLGCSSLLWHLEAVQRGRWPRRTLWIWPALFALWANLHQGFLVGLGLVGLYAFGEAITSRERSRFFLTWVLGCAAATVMTPHGIHLYRALWTIATNTVGISEWQRTPWKHLAVYWGVLIAFWGSLILRTCLTGRQKRWKQSIPLSFLLNAVALSYGSVRHTLHVPFFVLFAVPWVMEWLAGSRPLPTWTTPTAWGVIALFAIQSAWGIQGGIDTKKYPVEACRFIDRMNLPGPFFNSYAFGGYWMWHFGQRRPVFIDGRSPLVEGYAELWEAILRAQGGAPADWQAFLEKWHVRAALLDHPELSAPGSIYEAYFPASRWSLLYRDSTAAIYVRRSASAKASPARAR